MVCRCGWINLFLKVCAIGTKVSSEGMTFFFPPLCPNQLTLKYKCRYTTIWVTRDHDAGTDSKTAVLGGGGEG